MRRVFSFCSSIFSLVCIKDLESIKHKAHKINWGLFDIQVTNLINVDITRVAMTNLSSYLADTVILENIKIFNPYIKKYISRSNFI